MFFYAYNPARIFWCMYVLVGKLFYANCLNRVIVLVIINHPLLPATLKTHWLKMTHCTLLSFVSSPMTPALLSRLQRPESYSRKHFSFFKTKTFLLKKGDFRLLVDLTRFWTTVEEISHCLWIIFFLAHPFLVNSHTKLDSYVIRIGESRPAFTLDRTENQSSWKG